MKLFEKSTRGMARHVLTGVFLMTDLVITDARQTFADPLVRGIQGAVGGAIIGGVIGGKKGIGKGAVIGGAVGVVGGAIEDSERRRARRHYNRRHHVRRKARRVYSSPAPATSQLVYDTQTTLSDLGYDPGPADGVFGGKTSSAIKSYQTDAGLLVTGRPSNALLNHMRKTAGS